MHNQALAMPERVPKKTGGSYHFPLPKSTKLHIFINKLVSKKGQALTNVDEIVSQANSLKRKCHKDVQDYLMQITGCTDYLVAMQKLQACDEEQGSDPNRKEVKVVTHKLFRCFRGTEHAIRHMLWSRDDARYQKPPNPLQHTSEKTTQTWYA